VCRIGCGQGFRGATSGDQRNCDRGRGETFAGNSFHLHTVRLLLGRFAMIRKGVLPVVWGAQFAILSPD
jgi:hypothetical protein